MIAAGLIKLLCNYAHKPKNSLLKFGLQTSGNWLPKSDENKARAQKGTTQ